VDEAAQRLARATLLMSLVGRPTLGWPPPPAASESPSSKVGPPTNGGSAEAGANSRSARTGPPAETRLLVAILSEAIESLWKNSPRSNRRQRRLYREELTWLKAKNDESPFSFMYICTVLGLDPDYIRRGVLARDRSIAADLSLRAAGN